ncbi:hypothetical protein A0257_07650 [Hymenobacter psoromatis]|nr:hypothetical protein A0257_07650 [Hymenobacter psoromatis]
MLENYYLVKPFTFYFMRLPLSLSLLLLAGLLSNFTALAQVVAPSQGGEVGLVLVTSSTLEITFGTTGNGQGRVIAIAATKDGMPVKLAATNGTFYSAATAYGQGSALSQGYVVYVGTGHSATITGLKPSTSYYITDTEYNTDNTDILYNTYGVSMSVSTRPATAPIIAPLPVELTTFTGAVDIRNLATLNWTTATEQNTAYFALERSADGTAFAEVGRIAAASTSNKPLNYQWPDKQPLQAVTYYRLRQVDQDGTAHYSQVLTLLPTAATSSAKSVDVYPNPSAGQTIQLLVQGYTGEPLHLHLADALGRTVMTQTIIPADAHYLTALSLPQDIASGTYILTLAGSGSPIQKRIVVSD